MNTQSNIDRAYQLFLCDYPDVLNPSQVSEILGICQKTTQLLLMKQEIRSIKVGRLYRIPKLYLLQYLGLVPTEEISMQHK